MTVRDAVRQLESIDEVRDAGAAPTDVGQILCFLVQVDALALTDDVQRKLEAAVQRGIHGDVKVSASKDVYEPDTGEDVCAFWLFAYKVFGTTVVNGIEYDIIEYSESEGVTGVMADMTGGNPASGIERFRWSELQWRPDE